MVTTTTADNALKNFYLDAVSDSLNLKVNPFLARIKQTTADVYGKDVRKLVRVGISGGIGAGTETGDLPTAGSNDYVQLVSTLKNLYGTIEISDKALRASANDEGAFVNLLNDEMSSLVKSSTYNFGRMLFGDGTGIFTSVERCTAQNTIQVKDVSSIAEGMIISLFLGGSESSVAKRKVLKVNRETKEVVVDGAPFDMNQVIGGEEVGVQGSYGNELTGLAAIFKKTGTIYGLNKSDYAFLQPYTESDVGEISENAIQKVIDKIEENSGSKINFIICSWGVKRALAEYYRKNQTSLSTTEIEGGYTALNFNGIPVIADRFCPKGTMYLLNSDDFKLYQLCDWQWLESDNGKVLQKNASKPVYSATLVKYAELVCERPCGQGALYDITEA